MRRISMATWDELMAAVSERYGRAGWSERSKVLDEFAAVMGLHFKHAVRLFRGGTSNRRSGLRPGRRVYDVAVREALICGLGGVGSGVLQAATGASAGGAWRPLVDERCGSITSVYPGGFVGIHKQWQKVPTCGTSAMKRRSSWHSTITGLQLTGTVEFRDTLQIGELRRMR